MTDWQVEDRTPGNTVTGPQGPMGPKGDQGNLGMPGPLGPQGIQGLKGDQGIQGLKGDQGIQGPQGIQGIQGLKGDQGIQGPQGIPGVTQDISDLLPKDGDASRASVKATNAFVARSMGDRAADRIGPLDMLTAAADADYTLAIQAAINATKNIPAWLSGPSALRFMRRTLDLGGRVYKVSAPLDVTDCHGLRIINGGFYVDPTKPFATGRAVIENLNSEVRGLELSISIQCNHAANGINLQAFDSVRLVDCFVYGWGKREFGLKFGPQAYSVSSVIRGGGIFGYAEGYADNPVSTRTAIGLISTVADLNVFETYIHGGVENVQISSSTFLFGAHIWNGQPGAETTALVNNVNVRFIGSGGGWIGGQCDNGCIVCEGQVQARMIQNILFLSNQSTLDYCILFKATAAGLALADSVITGNLMTGPYDRFIKVDQSTGTYTQLTKFLVTDNVQRTTRAGYPGIPTKICATKGTGTFYIQASSFTGNTIKLDMRRFLLCPWIDAPMLAFGPPLLFGGTIGQVQSYTYDPSSGLATVTFSAPANSNSQIQVLFDQANEYGVLTAPPGGTTTPIGGGVL